MFFSGEEDAAYCMKSPVRSPDGTYIQVDGQLKYVLNGACK